ncbi:MAG: HTTM domain-containing protein [Polyangiaceae bacterium]|nr:HTTM domain-containing protein [Polyangiaceae bacterium]
MWARFTVRILRFRRPPFPRGAVSAFRELCQPSGWSVFFCLRAIPRMRAKPAAMASKKTDSANDASGSETGAPAPSSDGAVPKGFGGWMRHLFWEGPSLRELIRDAYFTFDRRTLGFTRILLGFLLIMDLFRRTADWNHMFANTGVLPASLNLSRPQAAYAFSLVNGFATEPELVLLWALIFVTYVCVLIGYKTKLAQILSVFWVASMNGRVLLIENGGYVVNNLLAMWTAFLPLGDRFSVDAWLESMRRKREASAERLNDRSDLVSEARLEPHITMLGLVLLLQLSAIYFFNVVHKTGPGWRKDFTAVHYVMYVDRMVTPLVGAVREAIPFGVLWAMTKFVIGAEAALPFCLLSPLAKRWARLTAVVLINILHVGFGSFFVLGPFAWSLCVFSTLLFTKEDWEDAIRTMRRPHRARSIAFDPAGTGAVLTARILARLDRFELLTFVEEPGLASGMAVRGADGKKITGARAWSQIIGALPLGPAVAWLLLVPPFSMLANALIERCENGAVTRFFGIGHVAAKEEESGPSRVRLKGRRVWGVLREVAIFAMFLGALDQALMELWVSREVWPKFISELNNTDFVKSTGVRLSPQPEPLRLLSHKLRYLQGWFMFSPNPVMDDGTVVVDAVTVDGRHVDAITGKPPNYDLLHAKSFGYNQIWSDYFNRIRMQGNQGYRDAMRQYILRYPERTGRPEDAIVSGEVYWLQDMCPRWGDPEHKSYGFRQELLFTFDRERLMTPPKNANKE